VLYTWFWWALAFQGKGAYFGVVLRNLFGSGVDRMVYTDNYIRINAAISA
jgi:hypothetical protein